MFYNSCLELVLYKAEIGKCYLKNKDRRYSFGFQNDEISLIKSRT